MSESAFNAGKICTVDHLLSIIVVTNGRSQICNHDVVGPMSNHLFIYIFHDNDGPTTPDLQTSGQPYKMLETTTITFKTLALVTPNHPTRQFPSLHSVLFLFILIFSKSFYMDSAQDLAILRSTLSGAVKLVPAIIVESALFGKAFTQWTCFPNCY